ncbi:hypothetical protein F4820DRAFT_465744 [Hypoxylon rubiginosum]|uniref:Uncharacterized protein n=1 Tax=Hypoxylon rubiginosum TaxID=110542 RepID=A0ACB9YLU6_9PEZI|nr:hypothetical protein F4820DRAFT_465744 [Hypoxylon rubiginosum]
MASQRADGAAAVVVPEKDIALVTRGPSTTLRGTKQGPKVTNKPAAKDSFPLGRNANTMKTKSQSSLLAVEGKSQYTSTANGFGQYQRLATPFINWLRRSTSRHRIYGDATQGPGIMPQKIEIKIEAGLVWLLQPANKTTLSQFRGKTNSDAATPTSALRDLQTTKAAGPQYFSINKCWGRGNPLKTGRVPPPLALADSHVEGFQTPCMSGLRGKCHPRVTDWRNSDIYLRTASSTPAEGDFKKAPATQNHELGPANPGAVRLSDLGYGRRELQESLGAGDSSKTADNHPPAESGVAPQEIQEPTLPHGQPSDQTNIRNPTKTNRISKALEAPEAGMTQKKNLTKRMLQCQQARHLYKRLPHPFLHYYILKRLGTDDLS